jgi:Ni,Fe-hydrogenase I large subunit
VQINLPKTPDTPESSSSGRSRSGNAIERDRARIYFQAYAADGAALPREGARRDPRRAHEDFEDFEVPDEAIGCGFHEAVRGVLSHHMVIRDGKIANYHPYPPTPWNASPRDSYGTPGPYEDAVQEQPIFEENGRELQGHRHHARGPQLRPVPAVRRAHVPRRCRAPLEAGRLDARLLTCASCGHVYDIHLAGRAADGGDQHLDPLPLLVEAGTIRIAIPAVHA